MDCEMMDECRHCSSGRVVPVLDVRIEQSPTAGNKYRTRCLECGRWLPMCGADDYENHLHPHVLPKDADPQAEDPTVPLEEWDNSERFQEVLDRLEDYADRDRPYTVVAADGGEQIEDVDDDEPADDEPENLFECPATGCDRVNEGYPDECPACGATYDW